MIRVFFSDALAKEYPNASKAVLSCDKARPTEIFGILESLIKQTGVDPNDKLSLGYLRRGLAIGKLRVMQGDKPPETEEISNGKNNEENPDKAEDQKEISFESFGDVFGEYMP